MDKVGDVFDDFADVVIVAAHDEDSYDENKGDAND